MKPFILFCKSYRNDVLRAKRLLESIVQFNVDHIPTYISVPETDIEIFKETIPWSTLNGMGRGEFHLITDEQIVLSNPKSSLETYRSMSGYLNQQVIKSEIWRLVPCESYLCLDSDSYFIREFKLSNFIHADGAPFSLLHDASGLLDLAKKLHKHKVIANFQKDCDAMRMEFHREGHNYEFGPAPLLWSSKVWQALDEQYLTPRQETLWQAIQRLPHEIKWYGEALLKFKPIPIHPIGPLFQVIHYDWQKKALKNEDMSQYLGVVSQSNWDKDLDPAFARKPFLSRLWRKVKYFIHNGF